MVDRPHRSSSHTMSWNNNGPSPWGNPGGNQGGGSSGGGGGGDGPPPHGPWGGGNGQGGGRGGGPRRPGGPFGGGPFGPGGPLPDIEALIRQAQAFIRGILPGGGFGGLPILIVIVVLLWAASGVYRVQPDEQGIVMRFGAYSYWTPPGLHWHLPWPIEEAEKPAVTRINRTEIGFRSGGAISPSPDSSGQSVVAESRMLTGDENIIDINMVVFWRIRANEAAKFLFNARHPEDLLSGIAESSLREVMGHTPILPALNEARQQIADEVNNQTQRILDRYDVGIEITAVNVQDSNPPPTVAASFRDVQNANTDQQRLRNEAEAYHNDIVPRARGDAAKILADGQGYKQAVVAEATGQSQRFEAVLATYRQAKDVTLRRLWLDTIQDALVHSHSLVVDDKLKNLVPFLPLNVPQAQQQPAAQPAPTSSQPGSAPR
jgi:modulator of FtsH protease HflK